MKILLVDDESAILDLLADMYEAHFSDTQITKSINGALALHECFQQKFDLICTDYKMPVMDGLELTEALRRKEGLNQKTGVIFLSGFIPEFKFKAETYEDVYFLEKPVHRESLMRMSSIAAKARLLNKVG